MKTLMCSLAAIVTVAVSATVLAEEMSDRGEEITGTVISVNHKQRSMVLDAGKPRGRLELMLFSDDLKVPRASEKVRVHCWYHNRGRYFTDKIEKLGNGDGDSKKRQSRSERESFREVCERRVNGSGPSIANFSGTMKEQVRHVGGS